MARVSDIGPSSRRTWETGRPDSSSMTSQAVWPSLPESKIVTMLGWLSWAVAMASRWKRSATDRSVVLVRSTALTATSRRSLSSVARNTCPIAPRPSGAQRR